MKKRIFSVLAIMCSMMLMMTGCGGANETDVNDGGINAVDNTMKFSELFEKDVIAYFGYLKEDDDLIGKDQEISRIGFFCSDGSVSEYSLGTKTSDSKVGGRGASKLGKLAKMKENQIEQSLVYVGNLSAEEYYTYQAQESEISYWYKDEEKYSLGLVTDETGNNVSYEGFEYDGSTSRFYDRKYSFGGHVQVYGSSYMYFQKKDSYSTELSASFMLIRDTEETKEKEIVFDDIGTDGIYVDGELGVTQDYDDSVTEG